MMGRTIARTVGETLLAMLSAFVCGVLFGVSLLGLVASDALTGQPPPLPVESPSPWPPHGPGCVDMAWLDGRWACIPGEAAG